MVHAKIRIPQWKKEVLKSHELCITNDLQDTDQKTRSSFKEEKEFAEESEKLDINIDFAREMKNICNINVTVILIIVGTLGTVPQRAVKETREPNDQREKWRLSWTPRVKIS